MNFKKLAIATSLALAALSASATPLDAVTGDIKIKFTGLTTEKVLWAGTNETTWGIGYINTLASTSGGGAWSAGQGGQYLYYMMYGVADDVIIQNGTNYSIYNNGATGTGTAADGKIHLDIFRSNVDLSTIYPDYLANPSLRTGFGSYSLFTGMETYLKLEFRDKVSVDDPTTSYDESLATLVQTALSDILPTTGTGNFFADVVGGTAKTQYDTNGDLYGYDMHGKFDLSGNRNCNAIRNTAGTCFAGLIDDPVIGNKIPEPGSLALFGLALAGLAGVSRRKSK
jgi:hypothetical protein